MIKVTLRFADSDDNLDDVLSGVLYALRNEADRIANLVISAHAEKVAD